MNPLRVLHVSAGLSPRGGGPPLAAVAMCRALANFGADVTLITPAGETARNWLTVKGPVDLEVLDELRADRAIRVRPFRTSWPHKFLNSGELTSLLEEIVPKIDIVHIHSLYRFTFLAAARFAYHNHVPYIVRPHGTFDTFHRSRARLAKVVYHQLVERRWLNRAAAIHYTSEAEHYQALPLHLKPRGLVIPLGLNLPQPQGDRERFLKSHPELRGKRVVVFLGRVTAKKGLDILVECLALLAVQYADVHLVIGGPDDEGYGRNVRRRASALGVGARITWLGMVSGHQKWDLLAAADAWTLPSRGENFGLAVIEALAAGAPVVVSDRVGIADVLTGSSAALVVGLGPREMSAAIGRLFNEPGLAERLRRNGPAVVGTHFAWSSIAEQLLSTYRALVASQLAITVNRETRL